jgi:hypothetical protein
MNKTAFPELNTSPFSIGGRSPYGRPLMGPDMISDPVKVMQLVSQDKGISRGQKQSVITMLNSPEFVDHILVGAAGAALGNAIAKYSNIPQPARTLLSLAGFGIGNIIYNTLQNREFISYDQETAKAKIKL